MAPLVFITGSTGFIGNATLNKTLEAGYRVRVAVRKEAQVEEIKERYSKYADVLDFAIVPDITAPAAYAGKLEGVDAILHIASPLVKGIDKSEVIPPAINGTLEILREAKKVPSVKKVVITASIATLTPVKEALPVGAIIKGMQLGENLLLFLFFYVIELC
jgi:nucleoside-diphosphate-sugar epimerase